MPNKWTTFVKDWATKNNTTYGCAISKPECKAEYQKANPKPLTKKQEKTREATERVTMGGQDVNIKPIPKPVAKPYESTLKMTPKLQEQLEAGRKIATKATQKYIKKAGLTDELAKYKAGGAVAGGAVSNKGNFNLSLYSEDAFNKWVERKQDKSYFGVKDKYGNYVLFNDYFLDIRGIYRPNGKFISFNDFEDLTEREQNSYKKLIDYINRRYPDYLNENDKDKKKTYLDSVEKKIRHFLK